MVRVALIGHGRMGREIERLCAGRSNVDVKTILTRENNAHASALTKSALKGIDVCIDFSSPESVLEHIKACAVAGVNIVVGTTGWYRDLAKAKRAVAKGKIGFLYSTNFSIGMNIYFRILSDAAGHFDGNRLYDVAIEEIHHKGKKDAPSGTALALGEIIIDRIRSKKTIIRGNPAKKLAPSQLQISSLRVGSATGTHRVVFDSAADTIELVHNAKDRSGFALGAIRAAEWLKGKKGVFTMNDVIG